jgi:uncharacterized protein (DUF427 family)
MMKAIWNNRVIAESDDIVSVEGNAYFPAESVNKEFLVESDTETFCGWKGTANYFSLKVDGQSNNDAAWYYADPKPQAEIVKGRVAFWNGVEVVEE